MQEEDVWLGEANSEWPLLTVQSCSVAKQNFLVMRFITDDVYLPLHSFTSWVCMQQIPLGSTMAGARCDYNICFAHVNKSVFRETGREEWCVCVCVCIVRGAAEDLSSVCGTLITILSDTRSHSRLLLPLNRELSWGPWSFIPGKLDPGEGAAGTDVRLQEALEAPGVSMTLASVLFW